jgi:hypothetical protein
LLSTGQLKQSREVERLWQTVREFTVDQVPPPALAAGPAPTDGNAALAVNDWSEF